MQSDTLQIDTFSIVPNSASLWQLPNYEPIEDAFFKINAARGRLIWLTKPPTDSIQITYRIFPFLLEKKYAHKDAKQIQRWQDQPTGGYKYEVGKRKELDIFDLGSGLDYNGSFGRGISFGNNQDVVVNSNFNLQMAGKLNNDIEIVAALSDNNIPFQAEGNTQQLQEFDRIFIQLKKDRHILLLGDYDLKRPNSYFMDYTRRLQGIQFSTGYKLGQGDLKASASGAIAKGNFNRMEFAGQEGNQGPYKLFGANNESFIIALSGSEKIFIDGNQLIRGSDNDYVIDYNTAEVTFTDNQIITKDRRIVIEFEYSDQNYLRSLFVVNTEYKTEKLAVRMNLFSEQDAKNQRLAEGEFSDNERTIFEAVGDDVQNAIVQNFDSIAFNPDRVLYRLADTTVLGQTYQIYVFSASPDSAFYGPSFRWVGSGNGNYRLSTRGVNGRVYEWVAPNELGVSNGNYAVGNQLIAPKKQQIMALAADYHFSPKNKVTAEFALSNKDVNTFSNLGDSDDAGIAAKVGYENVQSFGKEAAWKLTSAVDYQLVKEQFEPLEQFRNIEFNRDWNVQNSEKADEHNADIAVRLNKGSDLEIKYGFGAFLKSNDIYTGYQHRAGAKYRKNGWQFLAEGSYLTASDSLSESRFFRPKMDISKTFEKWKKVKLGVRGELEKNTIFLKNDADSTARSNQSFYYNQAEIYLQTPESADNHAQLSYVRRWDYAPINFDNDFALTTLASTFNFKGALAKNYRNQLRWNITYRKLDIADTSLTIQQAKNTLVGDLDYTLLIKKGLIKSTTQYLISSGQKERIQYFYQPTEDRNYGQYIYRGDANDNGIKDLAEFELGNDNDVLYADSVYFRFIIPSGEFQRTNKIQFNQLLALNPKVVWSEATGFKKILARFSTNSTFAVTREIIADSTSAADYIPIGSQFNEQSVVSESVNILNTLYYDRNSPTFDASVFQRNVARTSFLVNGIDKIRKKEQGATAKYNIGSKFSARLKGSVSTETNESEAFSNRNFEIDTWKTEPSLTYQPNNKFRLVTAYEFKNSESRPLPLTEPTDTTFTAVHQHRLKFDFRYGSPTKSVINVNFSYVSIAASQDINPNSSEAYNLLEGLRVGNNFIWALSFDTKVSGNILLNFSYDGRKSGDNKPNHVGRASLRAVF